MLNFLLASYKSPTHQTVHDVLCITLIVLMAVAALTAIILVLLQPSNSSGIDALGGSSETFFGKNKGKSIEAKLKKWTWICMAVLVVFSVAFFVVLKLPVFFA
ncbi:MAG: preprotein translocase subunit SecG [Clostridiales bacterium]|nr:preprotein translocase subunit SecG [Clostridiales bacterium]MBQ2769018.1 preprotein translocase subunit SecG [Clostridia bacterium]